MEKGFIIIMEEGIIILIMERIAILIIVELLIIVGLMVMTPPTQCRRLRIPSMSGC